jgi:dethiobiotin synthetase
MSNIFITGTDTGIGKTHVAVTLIKLFNQQGYETFGIKPIASGCSLNDTGKLVNEDALLLQEASSIKRSYDTVNPIAFKQPIAPHLAAKKSGVVLTASNVADKLNQSIQSEADVNIIEGVGGWAVPLNDREQVADVICSLKIPCILVVGIKLGCLNHAILTTQNMVQRQVPYIGWVANCLDPEALEVLGNIESLTSYISAPCLGVVAHDHSLFKELSFMNIDVITKQMMLFEKKYNR